MVNYPQQTQLTTIKYIIIVLLLTIISIDNSYSQLTSKDYYKMGLMAAKSGDHIKAIELFTKVMSMEPDNDIPVYNRARSKMQIGDKIGAITDYSIAIDINPYNYESYHNLGVIEYDDGNLDNALQYFKLSLNIDKTNVPAMLSIAKISYEKERFKDAITYFEMCIDNNKSLNILNREQINYCYLHLASVLAIEKRFEDALYNIDKALNINPNNYETSYIKSSILFELGEYSEAEKYITKSLTINPDFGYGYIVRGMINNKLNRNKEAESDFATAKDFGYITK